MLTENGGGLTNMLRAGDTRYV